MSKAEEEIDKRLRKVLRKSYRRQMIFSALILGCGLACVLIGALFFVNSERLAGLINMLAGIIYSSLAGYWINEMLLKQKILKETKDVLAVIEL
jgi:hypothetical protein